MRIGLPEVKYKPKNIKVKKIREYLRREFSRINLPMPFGFKVIQNKKTRRTGYSFGMDKFNDRFQIGLGNGYFSYRHNEVKNILEKSTTVLELSNQMNYDRGCGVFVYNIWDINGHP